jgi:uncharacterized protein (TIGR03000 family)
LEEKMSPPVERSEIMRRFVNTEAIAVCMLASAGAVHAAEASAPAAIHVTLPANAILMVDGEATKSTSGQRDFVTPALDPGKNYVCTLRAELASNGVVVTVERKVVLQAGSEVNVSLFIPRPYRYARPVPVYVPAPVHIEALEWPTTWTGR